MVDRRWELFGCSLWLVGCVLFAAVALDNQDWRSLVGSLLFLVGVVVFMVPLTRRP